MNCIHLFRPEENALAYGRVGHTHKCTKCGREEDCQLVPSKTIERSVAVGAHDRVTHVPAKQQHVCKTCGRAVYVPIG